MKAYRFATITLLILLVRALACGQAERIDLCFPGGSPSDLVEALSEAVGHQVNVIIPEAGKEISIPSFEVSGVTLENLLAGLAQSTNASDLKNGINISSYAFVRTDLENVPEAGELPPSQPIWKMDLRYTYGRRAAETPPVSVRPFEIAALLEVYSIDDISTAIHLTWEASESETFEPEIKFHPETKLLIVRGSAEHINLTVQVLDLLGNAVTRNAPAAAKQ